MASAGEGLIAEQDGRKQKMLVSSLKSAFISKPFFSQNLPENLLFC